mmetsp:Transcript_3080/g.5969  ORF Transcript_3080/g.5969 Transcript_3080/m.5969 type:complete len:204 (-) Transcript_3080:296-907(-)
MHKREESLVLLANEAKFNGHPSLSHLIPELRIRLECGAKVRAHNAKNIPPNVTDHEKTDLTRNLLQLFYFITLLAMDTCLLSRSVMSCGVPTLGARVIWMSSRCTSVYIVQPYYTHGVRGGFRTYVAICHMCTRCRRCAGADTIVEIVMQYHDRRWSRYNCLDNAMDDHLQIWNTFVTVQQEYLSFVPFRSYPITSPINSFHS